MATTQAEENSSREKLEGLSLKTLQVRAESLGIKIPGKGWPNCCPPKGNKSDIVKAILDHSGNAPSTMSSEDVESTSGGGGSGGSGGGGGEISPRASVKYKKGDKILFQQSRQHSTRAGYIYSSSKSGGYELRLCHSGGAITRQKNVSEVDARSQIRLVDPDTAEFKKFHCDFRALDEDVAKGKNKACDDDGGVAAEEEAPFRPLREALAAERYLPEAPKGPKLRLATFNVCHLGSSGSAPPEKVQNLAAVVRGSLADVVVLQEVSSRGKAAVQCVAEATGEGWRYCLSGLTGDSGPAAGECYALLWNEGRIFRSLSGDGEATGKDEVVAEDFMYNRRDTGNAAFRRAVGWGSDQRADFTFQGASAARLPGYFRLYLKTHSRERSIVVGTLHAAFTDRDTRRRQFAALGSLLPSEPLDVEMCIFALMGDFNSDAHAEGMTSFSQTAAGLRLAETLQSQCHFTSMLDDGNATSIGGTHYDEVFVQQEALRGTRKAKVYPTFERFIALGGGEGQALTTFTPPTMRAAPECSASQVLATFKKHVFTDHLLVYVDVCFQEGGSVQERTKTGAKKEGVKEEKRKTRPLVD